MVHVERIEFGEIVIEGRRYAHDVTIHPDGRVTPRSGGHHIRREEVEVVLREGAEVVVVGCGIYGVAKMREEDVEALRSKGAEIHLLKSPDAVEVLKKLSGKRRVGAIIHVTC
ncbi:MAG: hypothetical protein J7K08_02300 [Thermoplasmata archaeon]|nr:hypothetical protein [Thermoplasmata archaeon]OYT48118.1 MAG: hypothetical protein B6U83_04065 [Thermoplasmatales archaeon ex4484_36]HDD59462.1 hypothetical protein [Euryarchaeota archaeon]RLF55607.1 MAG: hypothetical protein DRN28_02965 [Thermoplasmata archaeon]RLF70850.1 MAG: hypothetical protein DRN40_03700 [Thermoplasmata archaeon]